jgi:hypothetical protein
MICLNVHDFVSYRTSNIMNSKKPKKSKPRPEANTKPLTSYFVKNQLCFQPVSTSNTNPGAPSSAERFGATFGGFGFEASDSDFVDAPKFTSSTQSVKPPISSQLQAQPFECASPAVQESITERMERALKRSKIVRLFGLWMLTTYVWHVSYPKPYLSNLKSHSVWITFI